MPIRFRCAYCNQLMAIAHRKAGTVVRCPKCAGDIIVPSPEEMPAPPEGELHQRVNATFEEDKGIERLLEPAATRAASTDLPQPPPAPAPYLLGPERTFGPEALYGLYLSRSALAFALVGIAALLAIAFGAGFLAGRSS